MPLPFHDILAEHLGIDSIEASDFLAEYLESLKEDLRSSGGVEVKGLGKFVSSDKQLYFEPHKSFQEAVNFRYGRLEVLQAVRRDPAVDDQSIGHLIDLDTVPDAVHTPVRGIEDPTDPAPEEASAIEEPADPVPPTTDASEPTRAAVPTEEPDIMDIDFVEILDHSEQQDQRETVDVEEGHDAPVSVPPDKSTNAEDRPSISSRNRTFERKERPLKRLSIIIPVLLVVSAIVFVIVSQTGDQSVTQQVAPQEETSLADESTQPIDDIVDAETETPTVIPDNESLPEVDILLSEASAPLLEPEASEDVTSGLTRSSDGYTMIVGSTFSVEAAQEELTRYADLGFITGVLSYDDEGVTRLRMAVGQYETIEEADSMRTAMTDQLPAGTWIRRIR